MIDRVHWINKDKLVKFILDCQVSLSGNGFFQTSGEPEFVNLLLYGVLNSRVAAKTLTDITFNFSYLQDMENGGISDRPDDAIDVFHTFFGVAGIY